MLSLLVYGKWLCQLVDGLFGNCHSHGCLFQMINGLFVNGTQL